MKQRKRRREKEGKDSGRFQSPLACGSSVISPPPTPNLSPITPHAQGMSGMAGHLMGGGIHRAPASLLIYGGSLAVFTAIISVDLNELQRIYLPVIGMRWALYPSEPTQRKRKLRMPSSRRHSRQRLVRQLLHRVITFYLPGKHPLPWSSERRSVSS